MQIEHEKEGWKECDQHTLAGCVMPSSVLYAGPSSAAGHKLLSDYLATLIVDNDQMSAA